MMKRGAILLFMFLCFFQIAHAQDQNAPAPTDPNAEHVQYWIRTLQTNPLVLVRKEAARHLGNLQDSSAVSPLLKGLADPAEEVKMQCANSLGRLGDTNALRPLYELIEKSGNSQIQSAARTAIDKINAHEEFKHQQKQKLKDMGVQN